MKPLISESGPTGLRFIVRPAAAARLAGWNRLEVSD
jgi:hypothetical protein